MILTSSTQDIERSGSSQEIQFSAILGAKAFDILSSAIYSDKPLAIVRELACNMYDGHIAAGNREVPSEIVLPTIFDPTLSFRDFGTGLSDAQICGYWVEPGEKRKDGSIVQGSREFVNGIYTTYFESSKSDSNEFIGALGLGSKSPFSYVDAFIIESRQNGVKRIYSAFKNEQRIPSIAKMSEIETDEPNGLTVSLSVDLNDIDTFENAARRALMYFDPMPIFVGNDDFKPYTVKHSFAGTNWKIREAEHWANMSGPYVIQGFVSYPINATVLENSNISLAAKRLLTTNMDLVVPMGDVTVAPSREALSYDPTTIANLVFAFEQAASEIQLSFRHKFNQCKSQWEMATLYSNIVENKTGLSAIFAQINKTSPIKWVSSDDVSYDIGTTVTYNTTDINLNEVAIKHMFLTKLVRSSNYKIARDTVSMLNDEACFAVTKDTILVMDDLGKSSDKTIMNYLQEQATKRNIKQTDIRAVVIVPATRTGVVSNDQTKLINMFGYPAGWIKTSAMTYIGYTPGQQAKSARRSQEAVRVWKGFRQKKNYWGGTDVNRKFSKMTWTDDTLPASGGGFYVHIDRYDIVQHSRFVQRYMDVCNDVSIKLGFITAKTPIYGVNKKQYEKIIKDDANWINFFDFAKAELDKWLVVNSIDNQVVKEALKTELGDPTLSFLTNAVVNGISIPTDSKMQEFINSIKPYFATPVDIDSVKELYKRLNMQQLTNIDNAQKTVKIVAKTMKVMLEYYPMLDVVHVDNWTKPVVLKYIRQCERNMTAAPILAPAVVFDAQDCTTIPF